MSRLTLELQRRVETLERMLSNLSRGSRGASREGEQLVIRSTQVGFPAELTGVWNASTGYPWKRLRLNGDAAPPAFENPGIQLTGDRAVSTDESTSLTSGTRGWMEPSPDGRGYVFVAEGTTGSSGITVQDDDGTPSYSGVTTLQFEGDDFTLSQPSAGVAKVTAISGGTLTAAQATSTTLSFNPTTDDTWEDSGFGITLPGTGTYVVTVAITVYAVVTASSPPSPACEAHTYGKIGSTGYAVLINHIRTTTSGLRVDQKRAAQFSQLVTVTGSTAVNFWLYKATVLQGSWLSGSPTAQGDSLAPARIMYAQVY